MSKETKKEERDWYCYVCGKSLPEDGSFLLFSLRDRTDRVFIACFTRECKARIESGAFFLQGRENKIYDF